MTKTKGQIGYEAYAVATGGKTWDGKPMPTWEAVAASGTKVAGAWEAAAQAVLEDDASARLGPFGDIHHTPLPGWPKTSEIARRVAACGGVLREMECDPQSNNLTLTCTGLTKDWAVVLVRILPNGCVLEWTQATAYHPSAVWDKMVKAS